MSRRIRPATAADHGHFVRLHPELRVDDPVTPPDRFAAHVAPTTFLVEEDDGGGVAVVGLLHYAIFDGVGFVHTIITDPRARRRGIGRTMMEEAMRRFRGAGCTECVLNVFPHNTAAIRLYESFGLARVHLNKALKVAWEAVDSRTRADGGAPPAGMRARTIAPEDDANVEPAMRLVPGQLASARAKGRVLLMLERDDGGVEGATVFDPWFPGAYPFRMARPDHAFALLAAVRPHARAEDTMVHLVVEGHPELADALLAAGATLRLETMHMRGPIPAAPPA